MKWQIIDTGKNSPEANMTLDCGLLQELQSTDNPILHFYEWDGDAATYGYFIEPLQFLSLEGIKKHRLQIARRPTGGGIVFHTADLAFSLLIPAQHPGFSLNTLDNYAYVNRFVAMAVEKMLGKKEPVRLLSKEGAEMDGASRSFCMAKPTKYDVMLGGRKVGGGAERRTKQGFLHQGTISLTVPSPHYLHDILIPGTQVMEAMQQNSYPLLGLSATSEELSEARKTLRHFLREAISELE